MGCDIHLYKEKFADGRWSTAEVWTDEYGEGADVAYANRFTERNYDLFGVLAKGVRREFDFSFEQRGMPLSPCPEVAAAYERWDGDAHSASYLYLHELKELSAWLKDKTLPVRGLMAADQHEKLLASINSTEPTDWHLLYPYCQGTTDRSYVEFEFDVPASFIVGDGLDRIVAAFDGIDGENHRVVFWFDN
jgi:hypothetical protein